MLGLVPLALFACRSAVSPEAPARIDLAAEQVRLDRPGPPTRPEGACWADHTTPAVIETETTQVLSAPAVLAADGALITPAAFRTVTRQVMLSDRADVWFRTPCPETLTPDFMATLQRALKARGLYPGALSGVMDEATLDGVRKYQAARGLDSAQLSLAAARDLGIVAADLQAEGN